ncbi:MAG: bifunctional lysine ketoglutarate reductase /saccharopine dehydrogenase family protein [Candidatus Aminicenantes bacterium]|nr:bifunctional lysine ketoglutarate reductase /saccharopine dehydrogenase family protein [Candidatus Aminicenantes bacterium]
MTGSHMNCVGVRREDKNKWERRAPLVPGHIKELKRDGVPFVVQPSPIRVFEDEEYRTAGAKISEDLSDCAVILAVKEIPLDLIRKNAVYLFFSHTIKGQPQNMPLLKKMMEMETTLIDYERIVDGKNSRLLFFGTQAGQAGMIETLHALGRRFRLTSGPNPFETIRQTCSYESLVEAREQIENVGRIIHRQGLGELPTPLVVGFSGYGRVSSGAQEIFDLLPHEEIEPNDLHDLAEKRRQTDHGLFKVVFKENHLVEPLSGRSFDLQDYYTRPEGYRSRFEHDLPFLTVLVNCIYWAPQYPRFVTKKALQALWRREKKPKLQVIGDISCDINGSIECTEKSTTPDSPTFVYDPQSGFIKDGVSGSGVVVMSIDNLPALLPRESSLFFSRSLKEFLPSLARADFSGRLEDCLLPEPLRRATILFRGRLTPEYAYLNRHLD